MSSRQQQGCLLAFTDVLTWTWGAVTWIASEVWGATVLAWLDRRREGRNRERGQ